MIGSPHGATCLLWEGFLDRGDPDSQAVAGAVDSFRRLCLLSAYHDMRRRGSAVPYRQCHRNRHHTTQATDSTVPHRRAGDAMLASAALHYWVDHCSQPTCGLGSTSNSPSPAASGFLNPASAVIHLDTCIVLFASLPRDLLISQPASAVRHVKPASREWNVASTGQSDSVRRPTFWPIFADHRAYGTRRLRAL
jgi:hypothetical protein